MKLSTRMQDRSVSGKVAYCHRLATAGLKLCIFIQLEALLSVSHGPPLL